MKIKIFFVLMLWLINLSAPKGWAATLTFSDTVNAGANTNWIHTLEDGDFNPALNPGEAIDLTEVRLDITADWTVGSYGIILVNAVGEPAGEGPYLLGNLLLPFSSANHLWEISITKDNILNAIEDRSFEVEIQLPAGGSMSNMSSTLWGKGSLVPIPEPATILLMGSGMLFLVTLSRKRGRH